MNFNKIVPAVLLVFLCQAGFGLDKWNILFVNFQNFSRVKEKSTGLTIQKSIASQLGKEKAFNLIQPKTNVLVDNFQNALNTGRAYKADVILYGDYFIEGEDLVVVIDVFDVLENRLKMRKYYSGAVDLDIFDTIDSMSADMVKKIKEVLPEMTAENQLKIRQVRQNIYEKEKVSVKRMFYTKFGFNTEMGPMHIYRMASDGSSFIPNSSTGDWMKYSSIPIGFALRFWDIRLDLMLSGLPGVPQVNWQGANNSVNNSGFPGNIFTLQLSYYLPWFNNSLALGVGFLNMGLIRYLYVDKEANTVGFYDMSEGKGFTVAFGLIWNPMPEMEFSLMIDPFMYTEQTNLALSPGVTNGVQYKIFSRVFPAVGLGGIFFLGNFGFEIKAFVDPYLYKEFTLDLNGNTNYFNGNGYISADITLASLYLGIVYRVDFMNQDK